MFFSKPPIRSTIYIENYNIIRISVEPELYDNIIKNLRKKDIDYLNSILFIDATSFQHTHYVKTLLNDKRFNIHSVKQIFQNACYFGNIDTIKLLINSDLKITEQDYIDSLIILMSHDISSDPTGRRFLKDNITKNNTDTIKFLMSIFDYDKSLLEKMFYSIYYFYAEQNKNHQKQLDYLDFIIELFVSLDIKSNKKIMNKIIDKDSECYDKELLDLLLLTHNINKF